MAYQARTKNEALLGVDYRARLHELHCRLYRRIRGGMTLFSLMAGCAAVVSIFEGMPAVVAVSGILVAFISYLDAIANFSVLSERHSLWASDFKRLKGRTASMSLGEIDTAIAELSAQATVEIESLRAVAMNDALTSNGYEDGTRPETRLQRFARVLA